MFALRSPPWTTFAVIATFVLMLLWGKVHRLGYTASHTSSEIVMVTASNRGKAIGDEAEYKLNVYLNRAAYAFRHACGLGFTLPLLLPRWWTQSLIALGYDFIWADTTPFAVPHTGALEWAKVGVINAAFAAFPKAKWVWWLDLDAIIMTPSVPVSTFLSPDGMRSIMLPPGTKIRGPEGFSQLNVSYPLRPMSRWNRNTRLDENQVNMLLTQDEVCGLNDGSFFLRRGTWADWILEMWTYPHYVEREWGLEQQAILNMMLQHKKVRNGVGIVHQRAINAYFGEDIIDHGPINRSDEVRHPALAWIGPNWRPGDLLVHLAGCSSNGWCDSAWRKSWKRRELERDEDIQGAIEKRERGEWGIEVELENPERCKCRKND